MKETLFINVFVFGLLSLIWRTDTVTNFLAKTIVFCLAVANLVLFLQK